MMDKAPVEYVVSGSSKDINPSTYIGKIVLGKTEFESIVRDGDIVGLMNYLQHSLKDISLSTIYKLPTGDSFMIDPMGYIVYWRKDNMQQQERWSISFASMKGKIPSLTYSAKGWKIGSGIRSGILSRLEITTILSHIAKDITYNRSKHLVGESHLMNLSVTKQI